MRERPPHTKASKRSKAKWHAGGIASAKWKMGRRETSIARTSGRDAREKLR